MNGILERSACDPLLDMRSLRARPNSELWRIWWRVTCALVVRNRERIRLWSERARARRTLALDAERMTEHELKDVGLTRQQVAWEANKPFWRE